jgi:hypothetical protein
MFLLALLAFEESSSLPDLKEIGLQKRLAGSYFAAFSTNRITVGLQNPQHLPSPSHFFAAILQVRQAASPLVNNTGKG